MSLENKLQLKTESFKKKKKRKKEVNLLPISNILNTPNPILIFHSRIEFLAKK